MLIENKHGISLSGNRRSAGWTSQELLEVLCWKDRLVASLWVAISSNELVGWPKHLQWPLPLDPPLPQSSARSPSSSDSSGDDEEVAPWDREGYICAVCLDVYFSPYMCHPCNHIFCEPCLRTLAKNSPANTPCPLCRTTITHVFFQKGEPRTAHSVQTSVWGSQSRSVRRPWPYGCVLNAAWVTVLCCVVLSAPADILAAKLLRGPSCRCPTGTAADLWFSSDQMSRPHGEDKIKYNLMFCCPPIEKNRERPCRVQIFFKWNVLKRQCSMCFYMMDYAFFLHNKSAQSNWTGCRQIWAELWMNNEAAWVTSACLQVCIWRRWAALWP